MAHTALSGGSPGVPAPAATGLSKSQRAYHWIKERIAAQEFTPGYRLVLGGIAAELGMSVVPVREAIRQLEAEGLVTFTRNVGAHVSMVDDAQYRYSMESLSVLEGAATALSAPQLRPADLNRARALNARLEESLSHFDPRSFTQLNHEFHQVLFSACPNPRLKDLVMNEWARLAHYRDSTFTFVPGRAKESVCEHSRLLDLIAAGAPAEQIESAARAHRSATLNSYLTQEGASRSAVPIRRELS